MCVIHHDLQVCYCYVQPVHDQFCQLGLKYESKMQDIEINIRLFWKIPRYKQMYYEDLTRIENCDVRHENDCTF